MNHKIIIPVFIGLLLISSAITAQLDPRKINHFDGLRGTSIYDITADRLGNLWFGTQSGLVKFDGYDYIRFHPDLEDSTTMGELLIYSLLSDSNGDVWIGCQGAIYRYNSAYKSFTRFRYDHLVNLDEFNFAGISTIVSDGLGRTYFGISSFSGNMASRALFYIEKGDDVLKSFPYPDSLNLASVYQTTRDPFGNVWLLDYSGVYKIDNNHNLTRIHLPQAMEIPENEGLSGVIADSSGTIWFSTTQSRLIAFYPEDQSLDIYNMPPVNDGIISGRYQVDMVLDKKQNIWFTSNYGLYVFDTQKKTFEGFGFEQNSHYLTVSAQGLFMDDSENIWYGTENNGLYKYGSKILLGSLVWDDYNPATITSGWVYKIWEGQNGKVWIASRGNVINSGISEIDLNTGKINPYPFTAISPGIRWQSILMETSPGHILFQTSDNKLKIFDMNTREIRDTSIAYLPENLYLINSIKDSRGIIWYCTYAGLIAHNPENNKTKSYDLSALPGSMPASNNVYAVVESDHYGLWIQTDYGLFLYDYETEEIVRKAWDKTGGGMVLSAQDINSLYEDPDGIVWIGTWQGGLNRYNPRTGDIKIYSINDGLPSTSIQGILADEKNNALWLSTFQGISRFNKSDEQFNNFSLADGIQGLLFADYQFYKTSKNIFIFGGSNGITYFNPDDIAKNSPPPRVYLSGFKIADHSLPVNPMKTSDNQVNDPIKLAHHQNNISIEYTGIQYDNPSENRFAYILENYDNSWRQVGNSRSAYYYNLPSGKYTFKVKAANSNGVWSDENVLISLSISPPWWKTWWAYSIYGFVLIFLLLAFDRIQRRRVVAKERRFAREKELAQAREIEKAYKELKATQTQLIHSEKMASLGELTAGIAHEIQNPLNFVNNFSEVSIELIDELKQDSAVSSQQSAVSSQQSAMEIIDDVRQNLDKILHHGKRADAIVKGMLQHSRTSSGQKEPTDINALADEYLRLAYHGLRAKDKSFNATMITDFDENIGNINIIPQDIGRVILNLITNAFYAVDEKKKQLASDLSALPNQTGQHSYEPTVTVSTKRSLSLQEKSRGEVWISVKDNGNGIPENITDKIFQPFFTTKPTGQGTGLGLSLSYDIVMAHGGELKVETKEGEGTGFIIVLPTSA